MFGRAQLWAAECSCGCSDTEDEESDQEDEEFVGGLTRRFSKELGKLTRLHTLILRGGWPNVPSLPQLTRLHRLEFCGESMFGLSPVRPDPHIPP